VGESVSVYVFSKVLATFDARRHQTYFIKEIRRVCGASFNFLRLRFDLLNMGLIVIDTVFEGRAHDIDPSEIPENIDLDRLYRDLIAMTPPRDPAEPGFGALNSLQESGAVNGQNLIAYDVNSIYPATQPFPRRS